MDFAFSFSLEKVFYAILIATDRQTLIMLKNKVFISNWRNYEHSRVLNHCFPKSVWLFKMNLEFLLTLPVCLSQSHYSWSTYDFSFNKLIFFLCLLQFDAGAKWKLMKTSQSPLHFFAIVLNLCIYCLSSLLFYMCHYIHTNVIWNQIYLFNKFQQEVHINN